MSEENYFELIEDHEEEIIQAYQDSILTLDDVPENFKDDYYQNHLEGWREDAQNEGKEKY